MAGSGFSFGTQPTTQAQPLGGFSFGGATSSTSTPSFTSTPFATTGLQGSQPGFGTAFTTTTPSLFGSTMSTFPTASTTSSLFPTFGQATTTSAPSAGFFGFGTGSQSTSALGFGTNISGTTAVTSAPVSIGLGGVDIQTTSVDSVINAGRKDKAIKETLLPNELAATIESFKKYIKEQKAVREEMTRASNKNVTRIQSQVLTLRQQLSVASNGLQRNALAIAKLKQETAEELKNAEIAQRTKDIPPSLQYENSAPSAYFHNLAINFENQMQAYRQQIELLERHLMSLSQPSAMTPDELTIVIKRLHDAFVTLAAQLQTVHQQVQHQKELFLSIQKTSQSELGNIFESRKALGTLPPSACLSLPVTLGPSPVVSTPSNTLVALAQARRRKQQLQGTNSLLGIGGMNTTFGTGLTGGGLLSNTQPSLGSGFNLQNTSIFKPLGVTGVPFGSSSLGSFSSESSPFGIGNQKTFQLQKPPSGNKRGKRWTST